MCPLLVDRRLGAGENCPQVVADDAEHLWPVDRGVAVEVVLEDEKRIEVRVLEDLHGHEMKMGELLQVGEVGKLSLCQFEDEALQEARAVRIHFQYDIDDCKHGRLT